jgi:hypothetical protein
MTWSHNFAEDLAKAGKSFCGIMDNLIKVYKDRSLKKYQTYRIIKASKERKTLLIRRDSKWWRIWSLPLFLALSPCKYNPYSPKHVPADFLRFSKLKKKLAGVTMSQEEFMKEWGRLLRSILKMESIRDFVRWKERFLKCICIGSSYTKKSRKKCFSLTLIIPSL